MTDSQKTALKHLLILVVSTLIPVLTTYISGLNFGDWQGAVTAGIAFIVLVIDTFLGIQPTPVVGANQPSANTQNS